MNEKWVTDVIPGAAEMNVDIIPDGKKWFLTNKLLPIAYTNVLISDGKHIGFGYMAIEGDTKVWKTHNIIKDILYWQELPKPPHEI